VTRPPELVGGDHRDFPDLASRGGTPAERVLVCEGYDHTIRWRPGTRLDDLFEERCDQLRDGHVAVDEGDEVLTYQQLEARANQLARHLIARGAHPGVRIGLLFDRSVHAYVAMLAVLKINAAYVPLDVGFPPERLAYIIDDAGVAMVLTLAHLRERFEAIAAVILCLDEAADVIGAQDERRLTDAEQGTPTDELCYVIYTSGSTGRPKGVAVEHASICNFVRVAVEVYGIDACDRVYQGMTIAFDFSVEEIWVPLIAGATLVPKPPASTLVGHDLTRFLVANRVTALCCVPTLLATLEEDVPSLRFLLVSGETCPQDLAGRWHRPGRRFLNVYGPTEATVTTTWAVVHPDRPVTIGVPLPTYAVVILDPAAELALSPGEVGEIAIAGVGLARGYLNRDDLTNATFVPDFLGIDNNPSARIYRSGDLGRINDEGEIEYHGRIDSQVKIRGYRIELTEIESVLLQAPGIAQAVVTTYEREPGLVDLVAYFTRRRDVAHVDREEVYGRLRQHLPRYMVPAYLEELAVIPMLPSDKADRKVLPAPRGPRHAAERHAYVAPSNATERLLAVALARTLHLEQPSVESHFFDDLGADSLLMARFCALVRRHEDLPSVSMQDVYLHPTIRRLAAGLGEEGPAPAEAAATAAEVPPTATVSYVACGVAQLLLFVASISLSVLVFGAGFGWVGAGTGLVDTWQRSLVFTVASFVVFSTLPVLGKWVLIGRFEPEEFPVWGLPYFRFWLVKLLIRANPMVLFVGSPLYVLYLRALGARIGRGVLILSKTVPVCTDLLTIGDGAVIRKEASFTCYRARGGRIETGPITLGANVAVGEHAVLDICTSMGDGAQLGHASSLRAGQSVPDGQRFAGSPGQRTDADDRAVEPIRCDPNRRITYSLAQLSNALVVSGPLLFALVASVPEKVPMFAGLTGPGHPSLTTAAFYHNALVVSLGLFLAPVLIALAFALAASHLLRPLLRPGRVYPLYGLSYWALRTTARATNLRFFTFLFGDSSAIVYYLQALGYHLSPIEQTGSNFGMAVEHDVPYLCAVGTGAMVSDGLSFANAEFSSTSFRVSQVTVGPRSFLGNAIVYPPAGKTGDNCLLGTKVMVPVDGPVREGVGLLGSPPFQIPRSVSRDSSVNDAVSGEELRCRLSAKNRHNGVTMALFLLARWFLFFAAVIGGSVTDDLYRRFGPLGLAAAVALALPANVAYCVLIDRAFTAHAALGPRLCSIYDRAFWRHERFWKVPAMLYLQPFNGTPFKNVIWRLLGVRLGRRCFDDGAWLTERTLVSIGDDCTLNAGSIIQGHSLEDGTFKSDHIVIGARCTLGTNAFVHYGVAMGEGAVLEADSFLMKGEEVSPGAKWRGNPAREIRTPPPRRAQRPPPALREPEGRPRPRPTLTRTGRSGPNATGT
jgi:non-ribosomal peptide synthetase-like protein